MVEVQHSVQSQGLLYMDTNSDDLHLNIGGFYTGRNEREKEHSPSQDSKKVRFTEATEVYDQYSSRRNSKQSTPRNKHVKSRHDTVFRSSGYNAKRNTNSNSEQSKGKLNNNSGLNSTLSTPRTNQRTSRDNPSTDNSCASQNYQFHASNLDNPDSSRLIFHNKEPVQKLNERNDKFKYHANGTDNVDHSASDGANDVAKSSKTNKVINENKSETSSKKSEVVPLPPPKQNGNLVTSDEHYSAHNKDGKNTGSSNTKNGRNNKAETTKNKGKRLLSDPEHQNRVQENIPRQSKSAPSENQKEQGTPRPQVNNFTKNLETDKTNGQTSVNKQDNDKRNKKNETTSPDVSKNYATHPELKTSQNTQSDAKSISSDKKGYTFKWKADPRKYTSPRTPRSKTPRSKTPRSKTPKFGAYRIKRNFGHRTRYTKSEPGDYRYDRNPRTPEPKRSILNNREAVKLEPNYSRPKSFKWERDKTMYRTQTRDWENERNELTYRPSVNSPTDWLKVYVGDIRIRETLKSSMSQRGSLGDDNDLSPNKASGVNGKPQREVILTRQQAKIYKNMHSVYGAGIANYKKTREKIFFDKLQDFHTFKTKLAMEDINEKQKKKQMSSRRQQIQLKELRQRFEDAAWVRFNTQYVTSRVLEHEKMNRYAYGLPEEVGGEPEYAAKLKRKSVKTNIDLEKVNKASKKKYGAMFKIYKGPEWERNAKTPPMEGIDTVVIEVEDPNEPRQMKDSEQNPETGNKKEVKRKVKNVIKEAKKEMEASKANSKSTGLTPRVDDNSNQKNNEIDLDDEDDDDDMSDIFERARKKYNLDIDEDEDALSRR